MKPPLLQYGDIMIRRKLYQLVVSRMSLYIPTRQWADQDSRILESCLLIGLRVAFTVP